MVQTPELNVRSDTYVRLSGFASRVSPGRHGQSRRPSAAGRGRRSAYPLTAMTPWENAQRSIQPLPSVYRRKDVRREVPKGRDFLSPSDVDIACACAPVVAALDRYDNESFNSYGPV